MGKITKIIFTDNIKMYTYLCLVSEFLTELH